MASIRILNHVEADMTRILLVGFAPETEDFSDPDRPPEMTSEKVIADLEYGLERIRERGWEVDRCFIRADERAEAAGPIVEQKLRSATAAYDCVVIGGGIRLPSKYLVFEAVINAVHRAAPTASMAFNSRPDETAEAAERGVTTRNSHSETR